MLALPFSDRSAAKIIEGWCFPEFSKKKVEQVGDAYELLKVKYAKLAEKMEKGASAQFDSSSDEEEETEKQEEVKRDRGFSEDDTEKKRHKKTKADIEREAMEMGDFYGALGLEHLTHKATEKDISKAYKKVALKVHPDKLGDKQTEEDKAKWLLLQKAYEVLLDPARRKKYDSSLPFDDSLPEEGSWTDATFYDVFHIVFSRNSMWSNKKPVPQIGLASTNINEVKKFYKFWDNFNTWREFS